MYATSAYPISISSFCNRFPSTHIQPKSLPYLSVLESSYSISITLAFFILLQVYSLASFPYSSTSFVGCTVSGVSTARNLNFFSCPFILNTAVSPSTQLTNVAVIFSSSFVSFMFVAVVLQVQLVPNDSPFAWYVPFSVSSAT